MNTKQFLKECAHRGISISLDDGSLSVKPENIPDKTVNFIRQHKTEIVEELSAKPTAANLSVLLSLPDGFQFWLAPDGMKFDAGGIPIIRRSVMDEMCGNSDEVKKQLHTMVTALREFGGDLRVTEGARPLPEPQKTVTGEMVKSL